MAITRQEWIDIKGEWANGSGGKLTTWDYVGGGVNPYLNPVLNPGGVVTGFYADVLDYQTRLEKAPKSVNISTSSANDSRQVAYGYCRIGGTVTFLTADEGETGQFLHVLVTFTGHKIESIEKLILDGAEVTFPAGVTGWAEGDWQDLVFASVQYGADDQTANSHMLSQSEALFPGKWTSAHRQRGCSGVYLILKYDGIMFPNGFPEIAVEGYFKNDIYDPRDSSTGWTDNAALIIANYITDSRYGFGASWDKIDETQLIAAANICDGLVGTSSGGATEKRYTINGSFVASSGYNHQAALSQFAAAIAGRIFFDGEKFKIQPGAWTSTVMALTEDDLRSALSVTVKPSKSAIYNAVKGQHYSAVNRWQMTDYPVVFNSYYQEQDNEQLFFELDLPFTSSHYAAQRIAKIALEQSRQWIELSASFSMRAYPLEPGDTVTMASAKLGWDFKSFTVIEKVDDPQVSGACLVKLTLRETASGVYDWNYGEQTEVDLAPNTRLPNPANLPTAQNLTLESGTDTLDIRTDGTVFARIKLSWDATTNPYIITTGRWEIQYKKSSVSDWQSSGYVDGSHSNAYILDVKDGVEYDVRIRAVTSAKGQWATAWGHFVVGKTANPSTPTGLAAITQTTGIFLSWSKITDLDAAGYEIRVGDWATGETIFRAAATSFLWQSQAAGSYIFHLRAIDTSGNYSSSSAAVQLDILPPGVVQGLNGLAIYNQVMLDWTEPLQQTFPIAQYRIYKGAVLIGSAAATLKTLFESVAGVYSYWVSAVDVYGNEGEATRVSLNVSAPPLFTLLADAILAPSGADTLTNVAVEGLTIVAPVDTGITYQDHFTDNSWSTPQDQVTAGYPLYAQPAVTSDAIYEQTFDYGEILTGALFSVTYLSEWADGSGTITMRLGYSEDDSTWYDTSDVTQLWASNFRYVRVRLTIAGADDTSLVRISQIRVRLDVKTESDSVTVSAVATDASGTLAVFNKDFLDIHEESIQVSHNGSAAYTPGFTVSGNEVRVFLWSDTATRVSGSINVKAEGVIAEV